jgi:two-component system sensor histidine kinase CpxA
LLLSRQQLLRDISHELRSPLARLGVALELARRDGAGRNASFLDKIGIEAERLNDLIGQLLALTRLEGNGATPERASVDLAELLERISMDADFEAAPRSRQVRLTMRQRVSINGNRELLHRAIENVVRNGVWYTAEGTAVEIVLDSRKINGQEEAVITVLDHGPGVPEESLSSLFRPFYRVGEARDRQSGGAGVGLAIAERAIRLHGGTIAAANHAPGGLRITIVLPRDGVSDRMA